MQYRWPVEAHPIGHAAAATVAWRHRDRLRVSVVVKASFSFVVDGLMPIVAPDDIYPTEVHHDGSAARSLWAASDLAPYRPQADVVLTGHALVPEESATVRLAVYRDRALIDKSLDVVPSGDFEGQGRVPLLYEHAPGGPEWDDNPVGTSLPSIVDSSDPQRPVGFGPIAATWPSRARRRGHLDPQALTAPVANLPDDLDWRYFSSAPADQVTDFLQGDEWIVLENLVAGHPLVRMRLPLAHAEVQVFGLGPGPGPTPLMLADHLHIDVDRARCSVTWRGSFDVASEKAMRRAMVRAGVAVAGQPIAWPPFPPPQRAPIIAPPAPPPAQPIAQPIAAPRPPAPSAPSSRDPVEENPFESTVTIGDEEDDHLGASNPALPFALPPLVRSAAPQAPIPPPSPDLEGTAILGDEPEEITVPRAPAFRRAVPGAAARPSQGIPGAPWSSVPAEPVQRPAPERDAMATTSVLHRDQLLARLDRTRTPGETAPPIAPAIVTAPPIITTPPIAAAPPAIPAPPPSAPAIPAPPPAPEKIEAKTAWSSVSVADKPKAEPPPPPPKKEPRPPVVQSALYNRFAAKKK